MSTPPSSKEFIDIFNLKSGLTFGIYKLTDIDAYKIPNKNEYKIKLYFESNGSPTIKDNNNLTDQLNEYIRDEKVIWSSEDPYLCTLKLGKITNKNRLFDIILN